MANSDGYALEHRQVLHDAGVRIPPGLQVHHLNGDKSDNRLENLQVKAASDHHRDHIRDAGVVGNQFGRWRLREPRQCDTCGAEFLPWLRTSRFCSRACANRRHLA